MQLRRVFTVAVALLLSLSMSRPASAQPLAELVPDDALIYIGWRGAGDLGPGYQGSHLKAVLEASNIAALVNDFLPRLTQRFGGPQENNPMAALAPLLAAAWKYPTALYYGGLQIAEDAPPMPRIALYIKAGADAAALTRTIQERLDASGAPVATTQKDGVVSIHMGRPPAVGKGIAANVRFAAAIKNAGKDPVLVAFADVEALLANVEQVVAQNARQQQRQRFTGIVDGLGLRGLKRVIITAGFEGKDWSTRAFIEAPAPRAGLLTLLDGKPVSDEALKLVPKGAAWMAASRMDLAKLVSDIRGLVQKLAPENAADFDQLFIEFKEEFGFDLEKDLLAALGDEWVAYTDDGVAGTGMLGMVVVNRVRDAKLASASLEKLQNRIGAMIGEQMGGQWREVEDQSFEFEDGRVPPPNAEPAFECTQADNGAEGKPAAGSMSRKHIIDGLTVHYLSLPGVAPAWSVDGKNLFIGLYPQAAASAAAHTKSGAASIMENAAYTATMKRLTASKAVNAVTFADLPQTAGEGYQIALLLSQLAMGAADMFGLQAPPLVLPPLHKLRPHLTAAASASWSDATGWYAASLTPFPGAEIIGAQQSMLVATQAMSAGIMLPALGAARRTARQMQSATHARGIHAGCVLYAQGARDNFPPDMATLYHGSYFSIEYVISPRDSKKIPADFRDWAKAKQSAWINENSSYILLPGKMANQESREIVIFERLHSPGMDVIPVCFNDNHVETLPVEEASRRIKEQTGKTLEEWSKVKTPGAGK